MDRKPKTIFQLDSPFTTVQWPQISSQHQETILELLCSLLSPIGQYRASHITASKGKRSRKRKRREAKLGEAPTSIPPPPEISSFVAIGLNSITQSLQNSSENLKRNTAPIEEYKDGESIPAEKKSKESMVANEETPSDANFPPECHFSAIFVCRSSQPAILNDHLLQLITTASLAHPELPATRLVELPRESDARLSEALGIPRVSFVGIIEDAPHSKSLVDLVREFVPEVEIPWLRQAKESKYLPVKINAIETFSTVVKKD